GLPPAGQTDYYLFKHGPYADDRYGPYPNMKGTDLKLSGTRADIDPTQGPVVLMQFTGHGNKLFHHVTKNEATRGSITGVDQHFAIVLDNEIKSWPSISYKNLPDGIDPTGSGAQITGLQSFNEAKNLAIVMLGVTMTLPGFAGLILTIGVAADANVVVFERIKEESRSGKSVRAAIAAGYRKGFRTILDANVVTAITALILFAFATAGVKGFALMLLIGTAISLITAVAATRAMLGLLAGF